MIHPLDPLMVRQLLRYDPSSGKLYWLPRSISFFGTSNYAERTMIGWNKKYSGREAFTAIGKDGYHRGAMFDKSYLAHRVIWALETEIWPINTIDHINGIRNDNRWMNLREATQAENTRNTSSHSNSSSRYLGVCWNKKRNRWQSNICVNRSQKHLGYFTDEQDAARAYNLAALKYHQEFAKLNCV